MELPARRERGSTRTAARAVVWASMALGLASLAAGWFTFQPVDTASGARRGHLSAARPPGTVSASPTGDTVVLSRLAFAGPRFAARYWLRLPLAPVAAAPPAVRLRTDVAEVAVQRVPSLALAALPATGGRSALPVVVALDLPDPAATARPVAVAGFEQRLEPPGAADSDRTHSIYVALTRPSPGQPARGRLGVAVAHAGAGGTRVAIVELPPGVTLSHGVRRGERGWSLAADRITTTDIVVAPGAPRRHELTLILEDEDGGEIERLAATIVVAEPEAAPSSAKRESDDAGSRPKARSAPTPAARRGAGPGTGTGPTEAAAKQPIVPQQQIENWPGL